MPCPKSCHSTMLHWKARHHPLVHRLGDRPLSLNLKCNPLEWTDQIVADTQLPLCT